MKIPTVRFRDAETPEFVNKAKDKVKGAASATKSKTTGVKNSAKAWVHERTETDESE